MRSLGWRCSGCCLGRSLVFASWAERGALASASMMFWLWLLLCVVPISSILSVDADVSSSSQDR